jgi:hypothetical protein
MSPAPFKLLKAGASKLVNRTIIPITTINSMSVKALERILGGITSEG